jgi:hypothetical protein
LTGPPNLSVRVSRRASFASANKALTESLPRRIKTLLAVGLGLVPRGEHGSDPLHVVCTRPALRVRRFGGVGGW